jgi:hypothetical protein
MQNPYAVERFIQEHNAHARAVAELQALQRRAAAERRRGVREAWAVRFTRFFRRPVGTLLARAGR